MPSPRALRAAALFALLVLVAQPSRAVCDDFGLPEGSEIVELETDLGTLCIELLREEAPITVENFVGYVERGDYDGTFLHLSAPDRLLQTGGFALDNEQNVVEVPELPPIVNEPCEPDSIVQAPNGTLVQVCSQRGNEAGTLAMVRDVNDPDSATNQWIINLIDNRTGLDRFPGQSAGLAVFARVLGDGMTIAEEIDNNLPRGDAEQLYWLSPTLVRERPGTFDFVPLQSAVPLRAEGMDFGCFDPERLAFVEESPSEPDGFFRTEVDPISGDVFFFISADCATQIQITTFQPEAGPASCPAPSQRATAVDAAMNASMQNPGGLPDPTDFDGDGEVDEFSVSCEQREAALTSREAWRADFRARLAPELVEIQQARLIQVPEPAAHALAAAAWATLIALRRARRRG